MAYRANPFLERMSESTTSDQEFVHLFSPKILERLSIDCLDNAVHIFRSPPGGGKTTILRAFTPNSLRAFWHAKPTQTESYKQLLELGALDETIGPQLLGVYLSCAAGYADLPPGSSTVNEGMFRALLDCRIVIRALRSLIDMTGGASASELDAITLEYDPQVQQLLVIPQHVNANDMLHWAEQRERDIYNQLDSFAESPGVPSTTPMDVRIEGVLWFQSVKFIHKGKPVAPKRLLMIDDTQKLRKSQRVMLIDELIVLRPKIPIWLASRNIAFADEFLSQGVRDGRDVKEYLLENLWPGGRSSQHFVSFAQNILDRRFSMQTTVPGVSFSQYLPEVIDSEDIEQVFKKALSQYESDIRHHASSLRYSEWLAKTEKQAEHPSLEALLDLYVTQILIARDVANRQLSLELVPLTTGEYEDREKSSVRAAAEIFCNYEFKVPYYFGLERLCALATNNVEELLVLAAALYDGMKAKQVLRRRSQPQLSPSEQDKRLREVASSKREFIPRSHTEGTRAQRLLDSVGIFCRERTFLKNAPYAPGVTGIRLSYAELERLIQAPKNTETHHAVLLRVLFECVAENLLVTRDSSASTSRDGGTVFYLNRTLCAYHGLPLQYGGWQDVATQKLIDWMERGLQPTRRLGLEIAQ